MGEQDFPNEANLVRKNICLRGIPKEFRTTSGQYVWVKPGDYVAKVEGGHLSFEANCYYFDDSGKKVELRTKIASTVRYAEACTKHNSQA